MDKTQTLADYIGKSPFAVPIHGHSDNKKLGIKFDKAKPQWSLVPSGVMPDVVDVLTKGAQKYAPDNWMHVPEARSRYYDACLRHLTAWWEGEERDPETGNSHLSHAICCLMFLHWFDQRKTNAHSTQLPVHGCQTQQARLDVCGGECKTYDPVSGSCNAK